MWLDSIKRRVYLSFLRARHPLKIIFDHLVRSEVMGGVLNV
jgi:hypothetical protein